MPSLTHLLFTNLQQDALFAAPVQLACMLRVEAALAKAEAAAGVIPAAAADVIAAVCRETEWDEEALAQQTLLAGNPAIPLVKALTQRVARRDAEAAKYVHFGATSQDVLDTALMLQLQTALHWLDAQQFQLYEHLAALANRHRNTPMMGRTLLQQARPITFGYKVASWLDGLLRAQERLAQVHAEALVLQFGGAVGTLATLGEQGPAVTAQLARELQLPVPLLPWHGQRDRLVDVATALAILCGLLGKMAHDVVLLMQTEVGELREGAAPGKGGSSAMPHKRNPVAATFLTAIAGRTPALVSTLLTGLSQHEHERAAGAWHAEWDVLPELCSLTAAALTHAIDLISGLEVDTERMQRNLALTQGLVFAEDITVALTPHLGKAAAHELIEKASQEAPRQGRHLQDYLFDEPVVRQHLSAEQLAAVFDPARATGLSQHFTDAVLARFHALVSPA
ncbi:3-carboxy-cis,cis-muconate cycloisomerase [Hymenobacter monticola]|uniref:3-carboxy-cis,cis-muconate cycloisomerase n=1 Tax=Hymenobacter monticola TaxID=1705399 RepID=A0ABY4BBF1_9BACT|nr:3-carboxy-cis,cis-muconate cycloisomerase [Hymenobacter monticola]UOE36501.1 3-carboxy-cis,cis-muconate cycloisomerase [Hymenobacter monticola]